MSFGKQKFDEVLAIFPTFDRDDRLNLVKQFEQNARCNIDFIMMIVLSTSLASLGLLADSTAVVIGAMLVAPLMGPLVAAGLALTQGNLNLFRNSLAVAGIGVAIGLAASLVFGALNRGYEPTLEIEARGHPDLLDLGIAFFSGMTAAYASGRFKVMTTLAGVAIAAALIPPLAVVGLALTHGFPTISLNAAILLVTNLVAIVIGAAIVFRMFGIQASSRDTPVPAWVRRTTMLLFLSLAFLIAPLLAQMMERKRSGQDRPAEYPLAPHVRQAVQHYISGWPGVELVSQGRSSVEPQAGITIIMMSANSLPPEFEQGLVKAVHDARGDEPVVRIFPILTARQRPAAEDTRQ